LVHLCKLSLNKKTNNNYDDQFVTSYFIFKSLSHSLSLFLSLRIYNLLKETVTVQLRLADYLSFSLLALMYPFSLPWAKLISSFSHALLLLLLPNAAILFWCVTLLFFLLATAHKYKTVSASISDE